MINTTSFRNEVYADYDGYPTWMKAEKFENCEVIMGDMKKNPFTAIAHVLTMALHAIA